MTWNCEGFNRVSHDLLNICSEEDIDIVFISEPWLFQADVSVATSIFSSTYSHYLNSEDLLDHELPLTSNRAHGGTLVLWKKAFDRYVSILNVSSSRILPIILAIPGCPVTAHICIYLPQANLEVEFIEHLTILEEVLEDIADKYGDIPVFIRGDANASVPVRPGNKRDNLFLFFCERLNLKSTETNHTTYHHFVGNGNSDSSIDVILQQ